MNIGIILGAGSGTRFAGKTPKQFCILNNKKVIDYSIIAFEKSKHIDKIIIVVPKDWREKIQKENQEHLVISGGNTRKDSSYLALEKCPKNTKNVLIHDSARPLVSTELIDTCILNLAENDAVIVSLKSTDTIIRVDDGNILNIEDREKLYLNQTPQGFKYDLILNAHRNTNSIETDDFSLINLDKNKCMIINGSHYNIKITNPEDLEIAKSIINNI